MTQANTALDTPELRTLADAGVLERLDGVEFSQLTTFHLGGAPRVAVRAATGEAAAAVVRALDAAGVELLIVGGGSNLLVTDEPLDVVAVLMGDDHLEIDASTGVLRAGAGAIWDEVVAASIDAGLGGLECLSGIPGSAGATPVQNVGAYGAEIADVLTRVQLLDRSTGAVEWVPASALDLAYRYSNLKFTARGVVLAVEFQLRTDGLSAPLRFGQLAGEPGQRRDPAEVREEVLGLRRSKGMVHDPEDHDTWSAGSFFTNPVVPETLADEITQVVAAELGADEAAGMPRFPVAAGSMATGGSDTGDSDGAAEALVKLSAAWLIDRAGFAKGYPGADAPARLSTKHTLALTNRGAARAADVVKLARDVRAGVQEKFGVQLEPEPLWIGLEI
ncbi:UDP-N-acetylmuramate dehydrogenase [Corynebacterium pseudodiphtheriticum]|uniref:UDP-N-acetylmuramate dehydrogenase n=1 Tax=Corynebacterium pseudodiphtheriticum TaxID=37637 RepID=UPI0021B072AA|nr:UDP-N-acetylmuramate dehydrogenase [Corynebacterium pseudodiphtheriticum]MCT1635708.1 UDP-N-acetylmuramate dehydrogenase [Corynebacterium pseudodiphtheriticum]MCT1666797.1 UDP-N-acetylmuramate dehydrogenase [Corynebacterium pseudodiphtheriticum]WKS29488.1 UDP-N-acetylmuramate dehydrogenase [Corynebacterium pseudodiphtheriticum]WKS50962.1 UDP-N-acetylmuramate dehydrogenase [Corynebacterium pseudodiphtheriticum]